MTAREPSKIAFGDCVKFHLMLVFSNVTEERQKYYINHQLKKPCKIPIRRNFANHVEQLNSYIVYLPGLINSPQCTDSMKRVEALDEPEIAQLLLQPVPQPHQDQYNLTKEIILHNLHSLLKTLETIKNMTKIHAPRKSEKSGDCSTDKKQKGSFKGDGNPNKKKILRNTVLSARNMEVST